MSNGASTGQAALRMQAITDAVWFKPAMLFAWGVAWLAVLLLPFIFFSGLGKSAQILNDAAVATFESELVPEIEQREVPKPLIAGVRGVVTREGLGVSYITLRNADRVILVTDGGLKDNFASLPGASARGWRGFFYSIVSYDYAQPLRQDGEIVGYVEYGISLRSALLGIGLAYWLVFLLWGAALIAAIRFVPQAVAAFKDLAQGRAERAKAVAREHPSAAKTRIKTSTSSGVNELELGDRLGLGYIAVNERGEISRINVNAARLLGYELRQLKGQGISQVLALEDMQGQALAVPLHKHLDAGSKPSRTRAWLRRRDGKLLGLEMHASAMTGDRETAASMLFWEASEEITVRREGAERAGLARTLLQTMEEAVILVDAKGRILQANSAAADLWKYPTSEFANVSLAELLPDPFADNRPAPVDAAQGQAHRKNGEQVAVSLSCQSLNWRGKAAFILLLHQVADQRTEIGEAAAEPLAKTPSAATYHDYLTALPTRKLLTQRLDHKLSQSACGLLVVDISDFKHINRDFNRDVGDRALAGFAEILSAIWADAEMIVRLGGDEFAGLFCGDGVSAQTLAAQAQALQDACSQGLALDDATLELRLDIGIVVAADDASDPDALIREGEIAMYTAKTRAQHEPVEYAPGMSALDTRTPLAAALRTALARDELLVTLQPICSLAEGHPIAAANVQLAWLQSGDGDDSVIDAEALWSQAREAQALASLASWCVRYLGRLHAEWRDMGVAPVPLVLPIPFAVLSEPSLARVWAVAMQRYQLGAGALILRLTGDDQTQEFAAPAGLRTMLELQQQEELDLDSPTSADFLALAPGITGQVPESREMLAGVKALGVYARQHGKGICAGPVATQEQSNALSAVGIDMVYGELAGEPLSTRRFLRHLARSATQPL